MGSHHDGPVTSSWHRFRFNGRITSFAPGRDPLYNCLACHVRLRYHPLRPERGQDPASLGTGLGTGNCTGQIRAGLVRQDSRGMFSKTLERHQRHFGYS